MNRPTLIIYDNTGRVWGLYMGETTVPAGVQGIIADAPQNFKSVYVNTATSPHTAVFELAPDTESEVNNLQDTVIEHEDRIAALESALETAGIVPPSMDNMTLQY